MLLFQLIVSCAVLSLGCARNHRQFTSFGALEGSLRGPRAPKTSINYNPDCDKPNRNQQSSRITTDVNSNTNSIVSGKEMTGDKYIGSATNEDSNVNGNEGLTDQNKDMNPDGNPENSSNREETTEDQNGLDSNLETTTNANNRNGRKHRNKGRKNSRRNRQNQNKNTKVIKKIYIKKIHIAHKG